MENEKKEINDVVYAAALVVVVVILAPIVINTVLTVGTMIYNACQPKLYEATLTYSDGSTETRRGTKKELNEWMKSKSECTPKYQ